MESLLAALPMLVWIYVYLVGGIVIVFAVVFLLAIITFFLDGKIPPPTLP